MVMRLRSNRSSILGLLIIGVIIAGTVYPIYYATVNGLLKFPNLLNPNQGNASQQITPDRFTNVIAESNLTYSDLFANVTQISIYAEGDSVGLSITWGDIGNLIWKLVVKAPDSDRWFATHQNLENNNTLYFLNLEGNNITFYFIFNKNYTHFNQIVCSTNKVGFLEIKFTPSQSNESVYLNQVTASFPTGVVEINLENSTIVDTNILVQVSSVELHFKNVTIINSFRTVSNVGTIGVYGTQLRMPKDTQIKVNTGTITFAITELSYVPSENATHCQIVTDVGTINLNVTFSTNTEAKIEAVTNLGSISYNEDTNLKIIEKKKTSLVLETSNYSEANGIKFTLSTNVGAINLKVSK
ncbi:MAG: hypothetical protein J7L47_09230 [Candidatus Odinarchaeota archaeon]|nr:hypothetical protein [Candidatus Odinarchaeota archaeon]